MPRIFCLLVVCVSLTTVGTAAEMKNGFYTLEEEGHGTAVNRASGGKLWVGGRESDQLGKVESWSLNNQNTRFRLFFTQAGPMRTKVEKRRIVMVVDQIAESVGSETSPNSAGLTDLIVDIANPQAAERIFKALAVEPTRRSHPGYKVTTEFQPTKSDWKAGEPVTLEMTITNVGDKPFIFESGGQQRGYRDNQFRFIAWPDGDDQRALPDTGSRVNHGGMSHLITLAPGKSFQQTIDLSRWFQFKGPNGYEITGVYELSVYADADEFGRQISRPIWNDFATGACHVRIETPAK